MNTRSLRIRLVLWYASWLVAVFCVGGFLLHAGLRKYLESSYSRNEEQRAERVAAVLRRAPFAPDRDIAAEITADFAPEASGRFIRVARSDGRLLYESGQPRDQSFDVREISHPRRKIGVRHEQQENGTELIIATVEAVPGVTVEAGESLAPALSEVRRLLVSIGLLFIPVALVALTGAFVLIRRALQPIQEITRAAERITSQNLSERLPDAASAEEFQHLSQALNRMIMRLDDAFQLNRRFLADASHELRTPLTVLYSELETFVQRSDLDAELRATAGELLDEVQRLTRVVENLFALSRLDAGQSHLAHSRFDLAKLAATTTEQMDLLAEDKQLTMTCDTPAPVLVDGDPARIKQVIVNLLDNAIKYTPSGGSVKLYVYATDHDGVLEVSDTGIGIPREALPRVFDRFFRVDAARTRDSGGAGIGLSIVKAICTAHGGTVDVESTVGTGSWFRVRLPLAVRTAALV